MLAALLNVGCGSHEAVAASTMNQSTEAVSTLESTEQLPMSQQPEQTLEESSTEAYVEEEKQKVDLVMVGDVLLHEKVAQSGQMPDETWQYDHLFAQVRDEIEAADLALVNQEVILGGRELGLSGYPSFNGGRGRYGICNRSKWNPNCNIELYVWNKRYIIAQRYALCSRYLE